MPEMFFANASDAEAALMSDYVTHEIKVKGYSTDAIAHIIKKHGINEELRGQKNMDHTDIALLSFLTDKDAKMTYADLSNQNHAVRYVKLHNGFEYHVIMVTHRRSKALMLKTMYAKVIT